jgi:PAS domain S-box-containing protein
MIVAVNHSTGTDDAVLVEQARVLEMIVRGQPLAEVLGALCRIVERDADPPVASSIVLVDAAGEPALPIDGPGPGWSMPILSSTGAVLGRFAIDVTSPRSPAPHERRLVEVLARTAALAIERDRADQQLRAHARRHGLLAELDAATQSLAEPTEVMATAARLLAEHLGTDRCAYAEIDDERVFDITGDYTRGVPSIVGRWPVAAFGAACVRHMLEGTPYVVDDTEHDPRITAADLPAYRATTIRGVICVPLHKAGRFTAAMAVHQQRPRRWSADEIELVGIVVARCWEALERSRVARTLRDSEARYRAIVEATPECVKVVAADGTILQMNAAGARMAEVASERDVVGRSVYELLAPEHRDAFRAFHQEVCRGHGGTLEFELIGAAGTRRAMETTAVPLATPTGFVHLAISRDVSARVAAARALVESRARLDYAVRLSGVGFWYCDLPFDELSWDARVKDHFFLPADARVTIETFYDRIHPEDREPTREAIAASIAGHTSYDIVYRTVEPGSGAIKWIRALGGTAYDPAGAPLHFDGVTVDVTAQKLDEARLSEVADQLRDQDRRKDEFLATLAHELRNPLAPIRTGLHVLQHDPTGAHAVRTHEMMARQLVHLVRMVDDLLDISRVTLGKITLQKARVDLRGVLDSALETTRSLVEAGGHALTVRLPDRPLVLDVDPTRLSQVFANLLNNAAKYTPSDGQIAITADADGATLTVRISDTGVGIPADMLPYVFDMFTQVGRSIERSQGGLGIGLTLVRRLVEMHGGTARAESAGPGLGSAFVVTLPLAPELSAEAASPRAEPGAPAVGGLRVLVVDDNIDAAETLATLLELRGHEARLAHTGPAALDAAAAFAPDLIFLDIGLPGFNGYEVARRLRADPALAQPMLVALTGWGTDEDRRQAKAVGFDGHLVKPVDLAKLEAALAGVRPTD